MDEQHHHHAQGPPPGEALTGVLYPFFGLIKGFGTLCRVAGVLLLLDLVVRRKNASGVSRKAQELSLLACIARFARIPLLTPYVIFIEPVGLVLLASSLAMVYTLRTQKLVPAYEPTQDVFHSKYVVLLCLFLGMAICYWGDFDVHPLDVRMFWHFRDVFANLIESWAMLPQLLMFYRNYVMHLTSHRGTVRWTLVLLGIQRHTEFVLFALNLSLYSRMWWQIVVLLLGIVELVPYWDILGCNGRLVIRFLLANFSEEGAALPEHKDEKDPAAP